MIRAGAKVAFYSIHQSSLRRAFFIFAMNILEKHELATEAIKAAPPLAVVGTSLAGAVSWSDVAYAMTALWMMVQTIWFIGVRLWRWKHGKPLDTVKGDK